MVHKHVCTRTLFCSFQVEDGCYGTLRNEPVKNMVITMETTTHHEAETAETAPRETGQPDAPPRHRQWTIVRTRTPSEPSRAEPSRSDPSRSERSRSYPSPSEPCRSDRSPSRSEPSESDSHESPPPAAPPAPPLRRMSQVQTI